MDYRAYVQESMGELNKSLRKDSRSVKNRIWSIVTDSEYVHEVSTAHGLPLVANERCGRWYIPTDRIRESVYFKSTDGHTTQWQFSTRRLNTHILPVIKECGGIVVVDSTRRGKRMPDALSKTVPVWCAVLNKVKFNLDMFYTPPNAVSRSEHSQIESLIPQFCEQLRAVSLEVDLDKPLRPIWVTPDSPLPPEPPVYEDFYPLVLCTASRMVQDGTEHREGFTYVQGAADDHEEWANLLTSDLLWSNIDLLKGLGTDEEIHREIERVAQNSSQDDGAASMTQIEPHGVWLGKYPGNKRYDCLVDLRENALENKDATVKLPLKPGKLGSKELRMNLANIVTSVPPLGSKSIAIVCDTGTDFSVAVALAIICKHSPEPANKQTIRKELAHIIAQHKCNPSRASLNAVNSYLMG